MQLNEWEGLRHAPDDISRKFSGTFVHASIKAVNRGEPTTCYLYNFDGRDCNVMWNPHNEVSVRWGNIDVIHPYPPQMGVIPHGNGVLFLKRNGHRQWQVGLTRANTFLWDHAGTQTIPTTDNAPSLFKPEYTKLSIEDALKQIQRDANMQALAINSTYYISRRGEGIALYRKRIPLGTFLYGSFFVNKACLDLRQELWDDLKIKV